VGRTGRFETVKLEEEKEARSDIMGKRPIFIPPVKSGALGRSKKPVQRT